MEPLEVRHYINEMISGDRGVWPLEWFHAHLDGKRFKRALSIGCGTGVLERHLISMGICDRVDAFDASLASLAEAASYARREKLPIRYFAADFNEPALPREPVYDAIFWHQSLHHVGKLEKLFRAVLHAAKPDATIYLDEFIGPSRIDWTEENVAPFQPMYETFPPERRWFDYMPFPIEWHDASEAARSSEIVPQLSIGFDIRELRGYGGNVLSVLWGAIIPSRISRDDVQRLIDADREAVAKSGKHFHAVIVATPKSGIARRIALIRYFITPKLKRILRLVRPYRFVMTQKRVMLHPELTREDAVKPYDQR